MFDAVFVAIKFEGNYNVPSDEVLSFEEKRADNDIFLSVRLAEIDNYSW